MIVRVFDFWPFSMAPGVGFLFIFMLLSVVFLGGARLLQSLLGRSNAPARSTGGAASPASAGLAIGTLPRPSDANAIALLRGGKNALVETMLADAVASGWLLERDGQVVLLADTYLPDRHARLLQEEIGKHMLVVSMVVQSARMVAEQIKPELEGRLQTAGLLRSSLERTLLAALPIAATVTLWLFAIARVEVREAHYGWAPFPAYLTFALITVTVAGVWLAAQTERVTPLGRKYLRFLEDASAALRHNVRTSASA